MTNLRGEPRSGIKFISYSLFMKLILKSSPNMLIGHFMLAILPDLIAVCSLVWCTNFAIGLSAELGNTSIPHVINC